MSANLAPDIRLLPLSKLVFSQTPTQVERRAHFDKTALKELGGTIEAKGRPEQLITVRPHADEGKFEVADGERRCIAAESVGLTEILCEIRHLTDEEVLDIQLVTGLQKEGLHAMVEAEGYETLQKRGLSAEEIADKVGKSKAYVYARMKLTELCPEGRAHFYGGNLSASSALAVARMPAQVQKLALKKVAVRDEDGPMAYREVMRILDHEFMTRLSEAPFDTKAEELVKGALPCGHCPKNTLSQPELFGDVKADRAGVCTDPGCFKAKREAWGRLKLAEARGKGQEIIVGAEAKKVSPYGGSTLGAGFARLNDKCWDDPKNRTYKQILGKEAKVALLEVPQDKSVVEVIRKADALKQLKADGVIQPVTKSRGGSSGKRANSSDNTEILLEERLWAALHAKAPAKLPKDSLTKLIEHEMDVVAQLPDGLEKAMGWDADTYDTEKLSESQLNQLLWLLLIADECSCGDRNTKLANLAKSLKIDVAGIRKQIAADQKAAASDSAAPAKASKKKAKK